ncbi:hypothetical protein D3C85_1532800 [compost metagenome]
MIVISVVDYQFTGTCKHTTIGIVSSQLKGFRQWNNLSCRIQISIQCNQGITRKVAAVVVIRHSFVVHVIERVNFALTKICEKTVANW